VLSAEARSDGFVDRKVNEIESSDDCSTSMFSVALELQRASSQQDCIHEISVEQLCEADEQTDGQKYNV
jgi:hypothetical protein